MPLARITPAEKHTILIVDDEPDIHTVTRLSLKGLRVQEREIEFVSAFSGDEAVRVLQANPAIAVILLDVVMETDSAGLDACRAIRNELDNHFVRILLRTGQPGAAPERQTIDDYDIDGYLPKAELTSGRLYSSVRTALKAWEELVELDRHRQLLTAIHHCVVSLHSFAPLEETLERILETAVTLCPTPLAVMRLETFEEEGNPVQCFLHLSTDPDPVRAEAAAAGVASSIRQNTSAQSRRVASLVENGFLIPLVLHRELGYGWIYLAQATPDALASTALPMLAAHAANALYSAVAQTMLANREGPLYDTLSI